MGASTDTIVSGAQTASGMSSAVTMTTNSMLVAAVNATAGSSVSHFSIWVVGSPDGTTYFDCLCDQILPGASTYAEGTERTNKRNLINDMTSFAATTVCGVIKHFPFKYAKLKWNGTFTSITFDGWLTNK